MYHISPLFCCFIIIPSFQHEQWREFDTYHGKRHADPTKAPIIIKFLQKNVFKKRYEDHAHVYLHASPLHHVKQRKHELPFLVAHGTRDMLVTIEDARSVGTIMIIQIEQCWELGVCELVFDFFSCFVW